MSGSAVKTSDNPNKQGQNVSQNSHSLWNNQQKRARNVGVVGRNQKQSEQVESNDNSTGVILEDHQINRLFIGNSLERQVGKDSIQTYFDKGGYQPGQEPEMLQVCRQTPCDYYVIDFDIGSQNDNYKNGADVARAVAEVEERRGNNPVFIANSTDGQSNDTIRQQIQSVMPNADIRTSDNKNDCATIISECEQAKQQVQKTQEQQQSSQRPSVNPQSGVFEQPPRPESGNQQPSTNRGPGGPGNNS